MEFLSWRNIAAVLLGAVVAGFVIGAYQLYLENKREELGKKLYEIETLIRKGKVKEAEKLTASLPAPSAAYGHLALGDYLAEHNDTDGAIGHFSKAAAALKDTDEALAYYALEREGYLLYLKGDYQKSLGVLSKIPEDAPNGCSVKLVKAQDYLALGQKDRARDLLTDLVQNCPDKELSLTAQYLLTINFK